MYHLFIRTKLKSETQRKSDENLNFVGNWRATKTKVVNIGAMFKHLPLFILQPHLEILEVGLFCFPDLSKVHLENEKNIACTIHKLVRYAQKGASTSSCSNIHFHVTSPFVLLF